MDQVTVDQDGQVAIVRFGNPPEGFIANKGAAQLLAAFDALLADDAVRAIILSGGQDGVFIRHAEVGQIERAGQAMASGRIDSCAFVNSPFVRLGALLDAAEKPVIAAIDGLCMGGGFEIALACTVRIAGDGAIAIGLPEIRIDIFPGGGGTQRLARLIGAHQARLFMLQGRVVDAHGALALGLVDEVVPNALSRATELARELAARHPDAVSAIMRLTCPGPADRFDEEAATFAGLVERQEVQDRLRRFIETGERLDALD